MRLALPLSNPVLAHGDGSLHPIQSVVEATGVADRLPFWRSPPHRGNLRGAIDTAEAHLPRRGKEFSHIGEERPVEAIDAEVDAAGVAQVMVVVLSPKGRVVDAAVGTFLVLGGGDQDGCC